MHVYLYVRTIMYVYVYTNMYILFVNVCIDMGIFVWVRTYVCGFTYHTYVCVHMYAHTHVNIC